MLAPRTNVQLNAERQTLARSVGGHEQEGPYVYSTILIHKWRPTPSGMSNQTGLSDRLIIRHSCSLEPRTFGQLPQISALSDSR